MVFEILGVNFLEIIKRYDYKGVPLPLARKMARQCLIGLDYMHRMCKIIHTDFKPENVVICLSDEQVKEIAENGLLTTSKMNNQNVKKNIKGFNEKLDNQQKHQQKQQAVAEEQIQKQDESVIDSLLTGKQKKNLKKKQKKKQKKQQQQNQDEEQARPKANQRKESDA